MGGRSERDAARSRPHDHGGSALTLVDSTAWIEFLNGSGHPVHLRLRAMLAASEPLCTTPPILMEVLRGIRDERHFAAMRALMLAFPRVLASEAAFLRAADLYRALRRGGITVRSSIDCLLVAIAEENSLALLHNDRDFVPLLRLTGVAAVALVD